MSSDLIPFQIDTNRVVELLAKQIYQSPMALLRENTQNAFDAARQRQDRESDFQPKIAISLTPNRIVVSDNGIGMTPTELQKHYWTAGSSSKNNPVARAAGVVGTFGIGAMANFGIADRLTVETESAVSGERTLSRAHRSKLDLNRECIQREFLPPTGRPGTTITADVASGHLLNVREARNYIADFVSLLDMPVSIDGTVVSQKSVEELIPPVPQTWRMTNVGMTIGTRLIADITVVLSNNADLWILLQNIVWDSSRIAGRLVLRTGLSTLRTFHGGFGLAVASIHSAYQFGGIADLLALEPTAGREAITVEGFRLLQSMMNAIDQFTTELLAHRDECNSSSAFMNWVAAHNRYDLCNNLRMTVSPGGQMSLGEISARTNTTSMPFYDGADREIIKAHSSPDSPLLILARTNPRRRCERGFLGYHASVTQVSGAPVVTGRRLYSEMSDAERALVYRIEVILDTDYFVKSAVELGDITHGLAVHADKVKGKLVVTLNPKNQSVNVLLSVHYTEYGVFGSIAKDFVRTVVFPQIAEYVPSSNREGAEVFLKAIRRSEPFEYALDDLADLPSIWKDYDEGQISLVQAVERSRAAVRYNVQIVEAAERAHDVVPDVIENEHVLSETTDGTLSIDPWPGITRLEISSPAKLLVIDEDQQALRGYRCFIAITDRAREEFGDFFLQPHTTSIVWGGQKTLFIFMHHSGQFGLYYDLQTQDVVSAPSGGGACPTCSMILKDRVYIPVPRDISRSFVPKEGGKKRFEVRADILRAGSNGI